MQPVPLNFPISILALTLATHVATAAVAQEFQAPPEAPVTVTHAAPGKPKPGIQALTTQYLFGNPTADEQLLLELLNRSRMYPAAEGVLLATTTDPDVVSAISYFGVNLTMMKSEMAALAPVMPLAPNQLLANSARSHSQWMLTNGIQAHDQLPSSPGGGATERITAAGYSWITAGENIYAYSTSPFFAHAGFEIDWGLVLGTGMQNPRGHRINDHTASFREVGMGIVNGTANGMGPQLVTQEFGQQPNSYIYITGVACYDLNGNNFYDVGEGISGLTVTSPGSLFHCLTAVGGGWVLPFPRSATTHSVTFSGPHLTQPRNASINAALDNVKLDLKLTYTAPAFTTAATGAVGLPATIAFAPVPGVSSYGFKAFRSAPAPAENCENTTNVIATLTPGYSLVEPSERQQGSASFHLAMPEGDPQTVEFKSLYHASASPTILFQSRLGWATGDQTATVELKEEGTSNWVPIYTQKGTNGQGEITWKSRFANITSWAGKYFRLRLRYTIASSYFPDTDPSSGWLVDAFQFTNIEALTQAASSTLATESTAFTPTLAGTYHFQVTPLNGTAVLPASWQLFTAAAPSGYVAWAMGFETATGLPAGTLANHAQDDYDHDGRPNFYEYALGTSPVVPNATSNSSTPQFQCVGNSANFDYIKNTALPDLVMLPQVSINGMNSWKSPGQAGAPAGFTDTLLSTNGNLQLRRASIPMSGANRAFFRLSVTLQ